MRWLCVALRLANLLVWSEVVASCVERATQARHASVARRGVPPPLATAARL
jgi:hypothetical protein